MSPRFARPPGGSPFRRADDDRFREPDDAPFPRSAQGWAIVSVLVAAYAVSFVDRQILSLLLGDLIGPGLWLLHRPRRIYAARAAAMRG